jgi:hypothetical protein
VPAAAAKRDRSRGEHEEQEDEPDRPELHQDLQILVVGVAYETAATVRCGP